MVTYTDFAATRDWVRLLVCILSYFFALTYNVQDRGLSSENEMRGIEAARGGLIEGERVGSINQSNKLSVNGLYRV